MNESETQRDDNTTPVDVTPTPTPETGSVVVETVEAASEIAAVETVEEAISATEAPAEINEVEFATSNKQTVEEKEEVKTEETTPVSSPVDVKEEGISFGAILLSVKQKWNRKWTLSLIAVVAAALIVLALLFVMERQGRIETGLFEGVNRLVDARTPAAKVNDGKVSKYDLDVSMAQMSTGFAAQGVDIESEEVKSEIQTRAIDMLINTELLKQEATANGIVITDEDVEERLEKLKTDVGGEELLKQRMAEFNVSEKILRRDIKNELTIQKLLEGVFKEKNVSVTDEEIEEFYAKAKGDEKEFPALEEVKEQISQQLKTTKEQEVVTAYIEELRNKAEIEILI